MPFSDIQGKSQIEEWLCQIKPSTALDIGAGSGTYGKMIRNEFPDIFTLEAVEVWGPYVEQFSLYGIYNQIYVCDVRHIDQGLTTGFDVAIIGDVIEHMPRHEAKAVLNRLISGNKNVIISFPVLHLDQDAYEGNWFEEHIDHWTEEEMDEFLSDRMFYTLDKYVGDVLACYLVQGEAA